MGTGSNHRALGLAEAGGDPATVAPRNRGHYYSCAMAGPEPGWSASSASRRCYGLPRARGRTGAASGASLAFREWEREAMTLGIQTLKTTGPDSGGRGPIWAGGGKPGQGGQ